MTADSYENRSERRARRQLLTKLLTVGGVSLASTLLPARWGSSDVNAATDIRFVVQNKRFMERAFELKREAEEAGDQSYGAIIVKDGRLVGKGPSRVITNQDPTAHAEMEAIRDAARRLGTRDLSGCVIYATSKPCRMCETASYWANASRFYYSAALTDGGRPRYSSC
ncbi:MAG: nucleoside deaminase [Acidiferrobacterales bacterium]